MAEPGSTAVMPPAPLYTRAPGKPLCQYGTKCYRKNPEHFAQFDHPVDHPYFIQDAACPAPPPPPAPHIAFPGGSGGSIDLVSSGEEDDNEIWTLPPSSMAIQNGLSVMRRTAAGPNDIRLARRTTYHTVFVANDKRDLATTMAARLTLAAVPD